VTHLALSPDKKTLVSGGVRDGFRVWDVETGKQKFSYFHKDDPRLPRVTEFPDGSRHVQDKARSAGVSFLPDGKTFLIAPQWTLAKAEIYFHDTETGRPVDFRDAVKRLPADPKGR
jgi:WD40 repeat protein